MILKTALLPDGREIACVNPYEVDFAVHEIFSQDLAAHGLSLPQDGVVFDVGANIGLFSLYTLQQAPSARIFAFEPVPQVFAALERNLKAAGPQAVAVPLGLGAEAGEVEFDYFPGVAALSTAHHEVGERMAGGIRDLLTGSAGEAVRAVIERTGAGELAQTEGFLDDLLRVERIRARIDTVSSQIAAYAVEAIDLLKIDTEGAEEEVLAGIAEADWPRIRQLMVEVHLGRPKLEEIAAGLAARGYRVTTDTHPLAEGGAAVFHVYAAR